MSSISKPGPLDILLLLIVAAIWGSAFTSIKMAVTDMGAMWTAAIRVFIGFLAVLPFAMLKPALPATIKIWALTAAVAALSMVFPFIMISWAMKHVDAGVGSLLLGTTPFIAIVIGHFATRDERITPMKLLGVAFAVTGIGVLVGPDAVTGLGDAALWAQGSIMLSGACYVCAGFIMRNIDMPPIAFTAVTLAIGSVMLFTLSYAIVGLPNTSPSRETQFALLWLGIFPTGFAYVMRYFLVRRVGVSTFALAMNTVPIFGVIIAAMLLGEILEWSTLIALMLVLCGLMITRMGSTRELQKEVE